MQRVVTAIKHFVLAFARGESKRRSVFFQAPRGFSSLHQIQPADPIGALFTALFLQFVWRAGSPLRSREKGKRVFNRIQYRQCTDAECASCWTARRPGSGSPRSHSKPLSFLSESCGQKPSYVVHSIDGGVNLWRFKGWASPTWSRRCTFRPFPASLLFCVPDTVSIKYEFSIFIRSRSVWFRSCWTQPQT